VIVMTDDQVVENFTTQAGILFDGRQVKELRNSILDLDRIGQI
jgi:hypothetical protein